MRLKREKRYRRHKRVRARVFGTAHCPRLCVFRSHQHIYGQLIDDEQGKTLVAASDLAMKKPDPSKVKGLKVKEQTRQGKIAIAYQVGQLMAKKALARKIIQVVFDRSGYKYHGRVKTLAEGARQGGLKF